MKTSSLTLTDRLGLCYGTLAFLLMLPVTIFVSAIPTVIVQNSISNKVLALTINMGILAFGALMTFLVAMVVGLAASYGLSWLGRKLHVQQVYAEVAQGRRPLEASKRINIGAFVGIALALIVFVTKGDAPINSVASRVEHLFPGPLTLSLGNLFSFDVSHTYAAATGFLSVGMLFAILGIAAGSLVFAAVETLAHRSH